MSRGTSNIIRARDVAELAEVSTSTVSRAFAPDSRISAETRDRILRAAKTLRYRPNGLARSLSAGRSNIIGLVVSYRENHFFPAILRVLLEVFQEAGYHVMLFMETDLTLKSGVFVEQMLDYRVDGLVLASVALSARLAAACRRLSIPVVLFNRYQDGQRLSVVTSDNPRAGADVARLLVAGRHQRIAFLAGPDEASTSRDREAGFVRELQAQGATLHAREQGAFDRAAAMAGTRRLLDRPAAARPDAIFAANDVMALAAMDVARFEFGLRIPQDISVVGHDDAPQAEWPTYRLTTVRLPTETMARLTVEILLRQFSRRRCAPTRHAIEAPLVLRDSARRPDQPLANAAV